MKTTQIETVDALSDQAFTKQYLKPQRPVRIKNFAKQFPAGNKWNLDYMKAVCAEVEVDVYDSRKQNNGTAYTKGDCKMPFGDFVDVLEQNTDNGLRLFLFNMFKKRPQLRADFPCPPIMKGLLGRMGYLFFGPKGVNVRMHQDIDNSNVLLTQFYGRKRVLLVAPRYSRYLYQLPFTTFSLVDLDRPDYQKYPALRHVEVIECLLEPGDAVFMPSGYWHYITYVDSGFSVSYRKMAQSPGAALKGLLNLAVLMPLDKLLQSLLKKNWLHTKEKLAHYFAQHAIKKTEQEHPEMLGATARESWLSWHRS